jgi:hypothetical protein
MGLSDFSRMRPFGLGSDISFLYALKCGGPYRSLQIVLQIILQ